MVSHIHASKAVVFYDAKYLQLCTEAALHKLIPGSFSLVDAAHLAERLDEECGILISFHGPYFPKAAWRAILKFLERGGNLAIFGGMPFACPVNDDGKAEPEQDAYTRQVYLGPFFQVATHARVLQLVADENAALLRDYQLTLSATAPGEFWSFYPMLTQASDHPQDLGSAGPIDTVLQPLIYAQGTASAGKRRLATPALVLDQRSGRFRGGRWLISAWRPSSEEGWLANAQAIQRLILFAAEPATIFDVRPALGCYQPGEAPSLVATARTSDRLQARITVFRPDGEDVAQRFEVAFPGSPVQQEQILRLPTEDRAGLYRIEAEYQLADGQPFTLKSGFWVWDEAIVSETSNKRLSSGRDYFYQEERPFLVYGTTYMDSRVQRKFLHLPNAGRWDRDVAEMKAAGINVIRTGIWTAWREFVPMAGVANEAFLRALDAFVMTMCKHNVQLIFTFFAFFPPLFEGENPWLDPRSVEAQQDFVALLARRYAQVELISWDLINEPSFGDPKKIFALRPLPNYDRFEVTAFQRWLAKRYTLSELQLRWRQTPADLPDWEHVLPPHEDDYDTSVRNTKVLASLKVADYTHFSQDMFKDWAARMVEAIRASGCRTMVGVGQDEAGTRLAPQFYAPVVDYTTTHPWWNVDDMLWDMLLDKTLGKPNLIQETGVMQLRDVDGRPWHSEQGQACLLERKLITGLIARGAGLIQWLWHTNGYMTNSNENSIGLVRSDGSAKPELEVMEEFGRLTQALEGRILEAPSTPDVWVVIPYSQWFARPTPARSGTQQAVRVLGYELGIIPQIVGEYQLDTLVNKQQRPRAVIVPAVQLLDQKAWDMLLEYVHEGGRVLLNGVIGHDRHNLPFAPGLAELDEEHRPVPVLRYEELKDSTGRTYQLTFAHEQMSYVKKAHNQVRHYRHGTGLLTWCGLPLELANETDVTRMLYAQIIENGVEKQDANNPYLICRQPLQDGTLILVVSESSRAQQIALNDEVEVIIEPGRAGAVILGRDKGIQTFGGVYWVGKQPGFLLS